MSKTARLTLPGAVASAVLMSAAMVPVHARADALTAAQILGQFNLVDYGTLSSSSEVEGRTFVGGDLTGSSTYGTRTLPSSSYATLTVDGSVASANVNTGGVTIGNGITGSLNLNNNGGGSPVSLVGGTISGNANFNGGSVTLANTPTGNVNYNGGATHTVQPGLAPTVPVSTFSSPITTLSTQLYGLTANSTITTSGNTATFNAVAGTNGVAVFSIANGSSFFSSIGQIQFNLNGATSVIVDVLGGGSITDQANFLGGSATGIAAETLWNFGAASNLAINAEFGGSILAENAAVTNSNSIDGTLVANSFTQNGEMHQYNYGGYLPPAVAVPEPISAALFGVGVLGVGLVARRRRRI
jgi:choice-of-anchor A domain-containing protein